MILNHLMGLYTHPKQEWQAIEKNHESLKSSLSHVLLIALIPAICSYIATAHIGWNPGAGEPIYLTSQSAIFMSAGMYFGLIAGVFALAYLAYWMAKTFDAKPSYTQALELASYTATPLFMVGLAALYPVLWFIMIVGLIGLAYSIYLLYWRAHHYEYPRRKRLYLCKFDGDGRLSTFGGTNGDQRYFMEFRFWTYVSISYLSRLKIDNKKEGSRGLLFI